MHSSLPVLAASVLLGALPFLAAAQTVPDTAPPDAPFQKVSELVTLPDFLPGLGTLYVDPATLPAGPFLGYDHDGKLSATIYMTPLEDLEGGQAFDDLALGRDSVASVDIYHNAGHPGVEKPHVHVVLYHDADAKARLAE
ncbi:hypothetical protein GCM10011402_38660 [Paracoccus acridae]|uniref:Uncharacterized protein n=1 Tax=Paracoccus acridae TaxID=1795310 RepID=A0ABQ1VNC9_9RHOB|nr:hypothetical protein [Paracoccus acridae]GGF82334.1 hypothetical protein GCM10011402_38660 [Paracoccus acridae]